MLPFAKRKSQNEEVELCEDDFELVEIVQVAPSVASVAFPSRSSADPKQTPKRPSSRPVSRKILGDDVEEDVAGQCLASIAAETARDASDASSSSEIRAALARAVSGAPSVESSAFAPPASTRTRLPSISAPPFLRTTKAPFSGYNDVPGVRDSSPPPAFVRRSSPGIPVLAPRLRGAPSSYVAVAAAAARAAAETNADSVAPVAMPMTERAHEPTVIVVRERPRAAWIFAAAAIGALGAVSAMRLLSDAPRPAGASSPPVAAATQLVPPVVAPPSTVVVAPAAPLASEEPVPAAVPLASPAMPPPAIVHFGEDEGVAIKSTPPRHPAAAPSASVAPPAPPVRSSGPRAPSMGPALPDGSFGLGRIDTGATTSAASAPPLTTSAAQGVAPGADPPRKHALTPEQQLAAAQLKASMK